MIPTCPTTSEPGFEAVATALGRSGDGLVRHEGETLFVPFLLPGERAMLGRAGRGHAHIARLIEASAERAAPPCPHFGRCGGCSLQHLQAGPLARFKLDRVRRALAEAGFTPPIETGFVAIPPASRRRMDLAVRRGAGGLELGLHARGSHAIEPITHCAVLDPPLLELVHALPDLLRPLACLRREGSAIANLLASGPDLLLATDGTPTAACRSRVAAFAAAHGLPRIAWRPLADPDAPPETLCSLRPATHRLATYLAGGVTIEPPPGAFLQASLAGEQAIAQAVLDALPARRSRRERVVELYAGCGTLSLAIAGHGWTVLAVEGHAASAACLRRAGASRGVEVAVRDLNRQPLLPAEFVRAAAVVLDPPWAGAGAQMAPLARAGVERIIMVSCNPSALERDGTVLRAAGYGLERLTVIDQFAWSAEIEAVAVFGKGRQGRCP